MIFQVGFPVQVTCYFHSGTWILINDLFIVERCSGCIELQANRFCWEWEGRVPPLGEESERA